MANYYLRFRQRVTGPFSAEELRAMAAARKIAGLHMVSSDKQNWTPADQVKGLFGPSEAEIAAQQETAAQAAATAAAADPTSNHTQPGTAKYCRTCGNPVHINAATCTKCGTLPRAGKAHCLHCGGDTHPQAVTCVHCGLLLAAEGGGGVDRTESMWGYFVKCLDTHYATFNGRASRTEYWGFVLFASIISILVLLGTSILAMLIREIAPLILTCVSLWFMALIFPTIAVTWRRLHDIGICGGGAIPVLIAFGVGTMGVASAVAARIIEPIVETVFGGVSRISNEFVIAAVISMVMGFISLLWVSIIDSESGDNRFGPNPKG